VARVPPSTLIVDWPLRLNTDRNDFLLYLVKEPQVSNRVFTRSSKYRANVKQTSSKHRAGSNRPIGTPPLAQIGLGS